MADLTQHLGRTLGESSPALQNFWKRDFPKRMYTFSYNMQVLREDYSATVHPKEDNDICIRFSNEESYVRFCLTWAGK